VLKCPDTWALHYEVQGPQLLCDWLVGNQGGGCNCDWSIQATVSD